MRKGATGMYDSKRTRHLILSIAALVLFSKGKFAHALDPAEINFIPHNKATATVSLVLASVDGATEYNYSVKNATYSARPIISFRLQIDVPISSLTVSGPASWDAFECCIKDVHRRNSSGIVVGGWLYGEAPTRIPAGGTLSGFKVRMKSVPSIKKFFIESASPTTVPKAEPGNEEEAQALEELTNFFNDSTSGWTLGPEPMPAVFDPVARIARIVAFKHQAADLGWLGGTKLVEKLDERLDQASAALSAGKKCVARARLIQFVHGLTNAHEHPSQASGNPRFANSEAFQLLKFNAESVSDLIPKTPKDRDEERECAKVEGEPTDD